MNPEAASVTTLDRQMINMMLLDELDRREQGLGGIKTMPGYTPQENALTARPGEPMTGTAMQINLPECYEHLRPILIAYDLPNDRRFADKLFDPDRKNSEGLNYKVSQMVGITDKKKTDMRSLIGEIHESVKQRAITPEKELQAGETYTTSLPTQKAVPEKKPPSIAQLVTPAAAEPKAKKKGEENSKNGKKGLSEIFKLKMAGGSMIANAIHNYELLVRLLTVDLRKQEEKKKEAKQTVNQTPAGPKTSTGLKTTEQAMPKTGPVQLVTPPQQTKSAPAPVSKIPVTRSPGIPLTAPETAAIKTRTEKKPGVFQSLVNAVRGAGKKNNPALTTAQTQPGTNSINQPVNQSKMESTQIAPRFDFSQVEKQLKDFGITRDLLEKSGNMGSLLNGNKTANVTINQTDKEGTVTPIKGALYITEVPGKGPTVFIQPERQEMKMPNYFLGHELNDKDKQNLIKNGDMGRVAELKDKNTGQLFKAYVGFDKNTNSLTVMRQDRFYMPSVVKGATLDQKQQDALKAGKPTLVKGMKGLDGKPFDAYVQISAAKRSLKFMRAPEQTKKQVQGQKQEVKPVIAATEKAKVETKKAVDQTATQKPVAKAAKKGGQKKVAEKKTAVETGTDVKTTVSTVAKNGQSRTSVDKSQNAPATGQKTDAKQGQSATPAKQGKEQVTQLTNGKTTSQKAGVTNANTPAPEAAKTVRQAEQKPKPKGMKMR